MFEQSAGDRGIVIDAGRMRSAQAKWDRLTVEDYAEIRTIPDLIARVIQRYNLPYEQALRDVEIWAKAMRA
jgi:hypothetical protein